MSIEVDRARGLEREGILSDRVQWNLPTAALFEEAVRRQEGLIAANGPLACLTGQHTGLSQEAAGTEFDDRDHVAETVPGVTATAPEMRTNMPAPVSPVVKS